MTHSKAALAICLVLLLSLGAGCRKKVTSEHDFVLNPEAYKGKTVSVQMSWDTFAGAIMVIPGGTALKFSTSPQLVLIKPGNVDMPVSKKECIFTFKCTKGKADEGNVLESIVEVD